MLYSYFIVFYLIFCEAFAKTSSIASIMSHPALSKYAVPDFFETYGKQIENTLLSDQIQDTQRLEKLAELENDHHSHSSDHPMDIDELKQLLDRLKSELHHMGESSSDLLEEKMRNICQVSRLRDGLKCVYSDITKIQYALDCYQRRLRKLQDYFLANKSKIVLVGQKEMGQLRSLVQNLQSVTENVESDGDDADQN